MGLKKAFLLSLCFPALLLPLGHVFSQVPPAERERSLAVPFRTPTGLAYDGSGFWVGDLSTGKISKIDPRTGEVRKTLDAPCFTVGAMAFDGKLLWVLDPGEKSIYGLDPESRITERLLPLDLPSPQGMAWDGKDIWISDGGDGSLVRIDRNDGTTYSSIPSPAAGSGRRSQITGFTWGNSSLWAADRLSDTMCQVDPQRGYVINILKTPGPYTSGLAFAEGRLACLDYEKRVIDIVKLPDHGEVARFNPRKEKVSFGESYRNFGPGVVQKLVVNIAVPGEMVFQDLTSPVRWDPKPASLETDRWGQKIAVFSFDDVKPQATVSAGFSLDATLYSVRFFVDPAKTGKTTDIPDDLKDRYLRDDTKLQIDSPVIRKAVTEAVGEETNCYFIVRNIYRYIHQKMHYEMVGGWNVAPVVLERGSGSCSEYSFVMMAMCRAAGIPARYAGSIVVRGDDASRDDVFHRWVEVYLPSTGWIPVDPSGGDSPVPEDQAKAFGGQDNRFLITTVGGGSSEYLNWDYNSSSSYTARGAVKVGFLKAGDWSPLSAERGGEPAADAGKKKTCAF